MDQSRNDHEYITLKEARRPQNGGCLVSVHGKQAPKINDCIIEDWMNARPAPLEFTVEDLIPEGMTSLLVADGGAGKSLLAQVALTCISVGKPFLGRQTKSGVAAGLFAEDSEAVLFGRQCQINSALGIEFEALRDRCFPQSYLGFDTTLWREGCLTEFFHQLRAQLSQMRDLRFLVIDNAALVFYDNENLRAEVTAFIRHLNGLADELKIGIFLSAHTSKSSDGTVTRAASGSTAWVNACRSVLKLESDGNGATLDLIKSNHSRPGLRILLYWRDGVLLPKPAPDSAEEQMQRHRIEQFICEQVEQWWNRDWPLSPTPSTAKRYLPRALSRSSEFKVTELQESMTQLIESGRLQIRRKSTRSSRGLQVVQRPA